MALKHGGRAARSSCPRDGRDAPRAGALRSRSRPDALYSHVIAVDHAPFAREHRGDVRVVGTAYAGLRLEGILSARVRRDGTNSARVLAAMIGGSRFASHTRLVLLQGIALAGFNVVNLRALHEALGIPVLVVARRPPRLASPRRDPRRAARSCPRRSEEMGPDRFGGTGSMGNGGAMRVGPVGAYFANDLEDRGAAGRLVGWRGEW